MSLDLREEEIDYFLMGRAAHMYGDGRIVGEHFCKQSNFAKQLLTLVSVPASLLEPCKSMLLGGTQLLVLALAASILPILLVVPPTHVLWFSQHHLPLNHGSPYSPWAESNGGHFFQAHRPN